MPSAAQAVRIYRELADWHQEQGQPQQRDRFLVLAADAALAGGQGDEAERLRGRLLQLNPHHLLKPYASFAEATRAGDVQSYLSALRQSHPWEAAERMLATLRPDELETRSDAPKEEPEPPVFRVRREPEERQAEPSRVRQTPQPQTRVAQPALPRAQPAAPPPGPPKPRGNLPPRPATRDDTFDLEPEPNPLPVRRPRGLEPEESAVFAGNVVPPLLFMLVLAAGMGLAVYTLARPFLAF